MGTTAEKLQKLRETKADIKSAIQSKGIAVDDIFSTYGDKIRSISGGGGDGQIENWLITNNYPNQILNIMEALEHSKTLNEDPTTTWDTYSANPKNERVALIVDPVHEVQMFGMAYKTGLLYIGGNLDTSQITNLSNQFRNNHNMSEFNVVSFPNVTTAGGCFANDYALKVLELNLPICTSVGDLCITCRSLETLTLTLPSDQQINFNSVTSGCWTLKRVTINGGGEVLFTNNYTRWFYDCPLLTDIDAVLNISAVTGFQAVFDNCNSLRNVKVKGLGGNGLSFSQCTNLSVESMVYLFENAQTVSGATYRIYLGSVNLAKLTQEQISIATSKGWTLQ